MSAHPGSERGHGQPGLGVCPACNRWGPITDGHYLCLRCEGYPARLTLRLRNEQYDLIERAAAYEGTDIAQFCMAACIDAARKAIAAHSPDAPATPETESER